MYCRERVVSPIGPAKGSIELAILQFAVMPLEIVCKFAKLTFVSSRPSPMLTHEIR